MVVSPSVERVVQPAGHPNGRGVRLIGLQPFQARLTEGRRWTANYPQLTLERIPKEPRLIESKVSDNPFDLWKSTIPAENARTPREQTACGLHTSARHFVLCSACRCQSSAVTGRVRLRNYLILLALLVDAQGIEPWTFPV